MKRRIALTVVGAVVLRVGTPALAQASRSQSRRLGILLFDRPESWAFFGPELRRELAGLGWFEGSNLTIDWHFAGGDGRRLPALAAKITRSGADAILTRGTPATRALQRATSTIPILTGLGDPIGGGFAQSLSHPGGNITGISYALAETSRKQVELLREMVPRLSRVTIVFDASKQAFASESTQAAQSAARESTITTQVVLVSNTDELRKALQPKGTSGVDAALVYGVASTEPNEIAAILLRSNLPSMFDQREFVVSGGLMSYRLNWENQTQRAAAQIDKVFRGEHPAQIPFEFPTRSEFIVNAKTAKALGLAIPRTILVRADEVIE